MILVTVGTTSDGEDTIVAVPRRGDLGATIVLEVELIVVALVVGADTNLGTINVVGEGDGDCTKNFATGVVAVSLSRIGLVVGVSKTLFLIVSKSCQEHKC